MTKREILEAHREEKRALFTIIAAMCNGDLPGEHLHHADLELGIELKEHVQALKESGFCDGGK